jgi:mannose-1-phosphate guanylyltransferase
MKGIIIAGGFGTRLQPLTYSRPKHLLPVVNRPFLEYQVELLRENGITKIAFATNYFADQIEAHFGNGSAFGVKMLYALEEEPLGTAGAIRNAASLFTNETTLVLNGDILTDFDLQEIISFHQGRSAAATIALRPVERPHAFGVLDTEHDGRVTAWKEPTEEEKRRIASEPGPRTGESDYINAGIYILEPAVIDAIPNGRPVSIERETYPALIAGGVPVYGVAPTGFWMDIGHPEQYLAANRAVLMREVRTHVPFSQFGEGVEIAPDAVIDSDVSIGKECRVGSGSRLSGCIILDGVTIGENVVLDGLIAEEKCEIGDGTTSRGGCILARGSRVERGSRI